MELFVNVLIFVTAIVGGIVKQVIQYAIVSRNAKERDNIIYVESDVPNAAALTFLNRIIVYGELGSSTEFALLHESYHLRQKKVAFLQLVVVAFFASLLPYSLAFLALMYLSYIMINWKIEQDADLYAYSKGGKYEARYGRPKSRLLRLLAWLLDSHPPDYIRVKEEYRTKNVYYLFLRDIIS